MKAFAFAGFGSTRDVKDHTISVSLHTKTKNMHASWTAIWASCGRANPVASVATQDLFNTNSVYFRNREQHRGC